MSLPQLLDERDVTPLPASFSHEQYMETGVFSLQFLAILSLAIYDIDLIQ